MPWKECNIVEERLRFIARLLDGEKMAVWRVLCGGCSAAVPANFRGFTSIAVVLE